VANNKAFLNLATTVNSSIANLETNYYKKDDVDGAINTAKAGLLLKSELGQAIAQLNTYYTKREVDGAISTSRAGLVLQSDYNSAMTELNSSIDDIEASIATAVTRDPETGKVTSTVTFGADNAELNKDGSGYFAQGNLYWDENGKITIQNPEDAYNRVSMNLADDGIKFNGTGARTAEIGRISVDGV